MNRSMFIIALSIIGLAVIGFGRQLFTNPSGLLTSILIFVVIGIIIWLIYTRVSTSSNQSKYKKAVRQSKKYHQNKATGKVKNARKGKVTDLGQSRNKKTHMTNRRKKSDVHLTVIEGKKGKKKNQA